MNKRERSSESLLLFQTFTCLVDYKFKIQHSFNWRIQYCFFEKSNNSFVISGLSLNQIFHDLGTCLNLLFRKLRSAVNLVLGNLES